jgi:hypothetical protein
MTNEAADRLRWEIGSAYRINLLDDALADERKATVERFMHYIQHEPDCALRTAEGDCVCGLASLLDAEAAR